MKNKNKEEKQIPKMKKFNAKKTKVATIAMIAVFTLLTSCGDSSNVSFDSTQEKDIISSSALDVAVFSLKFDGVEVNIGKTHFKELNEKGWRADETKTDVKTLGSDTKDVPVRISLVNTQKSVYTENNDIRVSLATSREGSCDIEDGIIRSIYIKPGENKDSLPDITLPKGLAFGMSYNDIISNIGKPSEQSDNLTQHIMTYYFDKGQFVLEVESDASGNGKGLTSINIVGM
ncbi:MAG: hypothetical protein K6F27_09610 [Ruminococcus sp.]|nr:hypothetical protein [Ruminococcus sp.]